jgi:hypothetical protein
MEYQRCHAIGHRWENIPVTRPPAFGAAIDLRCENCATVRRDIISRISGVLITRYYVYPDDYHDYERHDKAWWRAAFAESLYMAARNYIDTSNEKAQFDKGARRVAKKAWMEVVVPIAQAGPPRPSPTPAQPSRRNQTARKAMKAT